MRRDVETDDQAEAMVAADSHQAIAARIHRMVTAGRGMVLAVREFTYTGRPAVLYAGLRLDSEHYGGGLAVSDHGDQLSFSARLTNGGMRIDDVRWFGYSVRTFQHSGNESEEQAWQRFRAKRAEGDRSERRHNMTHVEFVGGLPGWKWQTTDRITITDWNDDGVASEWVLGFEPGEGSW